MSGAGKNLQETGLSSRWWDTGEFLGAEHAWADLHARSTASPLFLGWHWQSTWWRHFAESNGLGLRMLAVYDAGGRLVGLAPMFSTTRRFKGLRIRSLQIVGNIWRGPSTVVSEYLKFIVDAAHADAVVTHIADTLAGLGDVDELVVTNSHVHDPVVERLLERMRQKKHLVRIIDRSESRQIDTTGDFDEYLKQLGSKTRRELFNKRKKLEEMGGVTFEMLGPGDEDRGIELLNDFHRRRFGVPVYEGARLEFQKDMMRQLAEKGQLAYSVLHVDGKVEACKYNVRVGGIDYGIQTGFNQQLSNKISLGKLQLGYAVEHAFDEQATEFDFLAGGGKAEDYKMHLAKQVREIGTVHIVTSRFLKGVYKFGMRLGAIAKE